MTTLAITGGKPLLLRPGGQPWTVPKQQPHRRELPIVFEGNKPDQQSGSMTTFKNWAAEVQIYMSLEDHNLATVMNEAKEQT
eukprot:6480171-Amphidinium_carterae.3